MTAPDIAPLLDAWVAHLADVTGHKIGLGLRPSDAGFKASGFVPYVVVWPGSSLQSATLDDLHHDQRTPLQHSCWATSPAVAGRLADDLVAAVTAADLSELAGIRLLEVRVDTGRRGPLRDPDDERLWAVHLPVRIWT